MLGFVMVGTNTLNEAANFYDILLEILDLKRVCTTDRYVGYALKNNSENIEFYVTMPVNLERATSGNGTQISFITQTKKNVNKFYETGINLGGKSEGAPDVRSGYYYSYLRDLDGNKICAFTKINK